MKVKVFTSGSWEAFQNSVNEFIKDKKVCDIKYQPVILTNESLMAGRGIVSDLIYSALVMYEEDKHE